MRIPTLGTVMLLGAFAAGILPVAVLADELTPPEPVGGERRQALLEIIDMAADALTAKEFDSLEKYCGPNCTIITPEQQVYTDFQAFRKGYDSIFEGSSAWLTSARYRPEADFQVKDIGEDRVMITGISNDALQFISGETRVITHRWSALLKVAESGFQLEHLQVAANYRDNPILTQHEDMSLYAAIGGLVFGLVFGSWATSKLRGFPHEEQDVEQGAAR